MTRRWIVAAAAAVAWPLAAHAQVPPDIAAAIRANGEAMTNTAGPLYAPLFPPEAWQGITITRDLAYGADPKQVLDVYVPEAGARGLPVLLFVHGGGFAGGDKHGAFYPDNITLWAAREGMVGVNVNYRLAPGAAFPEAARDLAATIAWTRANIARFGGDPDRIVLFGHSAGGNHVADYLGNPELRGAEQAGVIGAVLLSPAYPGYPPNVWPHPYYGTNDELNSPAGSIRRLWTNSVPLFLADAEFDPADMRNYAKALREGLCEVRTRCPTYLRLKDHNHFTEGMALGTSDRSLADPLARWIKALP